MGPDEPHVQASESAGATVKAGLAVLVALLIAAPAAANPPSRVTIVAVFDPITYGENAYVNGQLLGDAQGDQLIALEQAPPPFTEWTPVAQATSDAQGYYSFKLHPSQTMQYRTISQGTPSDRAVQVSLAPRISLKAQPAGKSSVRFSGSFAPALDGQSVAIQRRNPGGSWTTIGNARLQGGKTFAGRVRTHKRIQLRAFFATDGSHLDGFSNDVTVTPGKAAASKATAAACRSPRITRISTNSAPTAGEPFTLRVRSAMTDGKIYAIDVRWGEGDTRDHLTLAPQFRKPKVLFTLRHRYGKPGTYSATIRVFASAAGCKRSSATERRPLRVLSPSS
jgi:hypothetical protein